MSASLLETGAPTLHVSTPTQLDSNAVVLVNVQRGTHSITRDRVTKHKHIVVSFVTVAEANKHPQQRHVKQGQCTTPTSSCGWMHVRKSPGEHLGQHDPKGVHINELVVVCTGSHHRLPAQWRRKVGITTICGTKTKQTNQRQQAELPCTRPHTLSDARCHVRWCAHEPSLGR